MALTFWQSHDQEQANNKTKRKKKKKDRSSRIKDKEEKEQISNGALNEEDGLIPPTGAEARESRSPPGSDDLCFPCLPGLDDEPKPAGREKGDEKKRSELDPVAMGSPVPEPQDYWLMRLFQSNLFDMSIAIGYLFNAKEPDVQAYLCQKLFVSAFVCVVWSCVVNNCQIIKLSHVVCLLSSTCYYYNTTPIVFECPLYTSLCLLFRVLMLAMLISIYLN